MGDEVLYPPYSLLVYHLTSLSESNVNEYVGIQNKLSKSHSFLYMIGQKYLNDWHVGTVKYQIPKAKL